jgi:hypothetical protein
VTAGTVFHRTRTPLRICTRANNLQGWQQDFAKAKSILEITTNVPGHNQKHDEVLKAIETDDPNNFAVNSNPA